MERTIIFSTLTFGTQCDKKKSQTMNKPMSLFSILHCNLILWCKHVIVSKLFLHQSGLTLKVRSLYQVELKVSPFTPLTMCASQHLGPRWVVIEVVSAEPFCQVKHSKKPVTRKPQCSPALLGPCTPHMLPKLALDGWCD